MVRAAAQDFVRHSAVPQADCEKSVEKQPLNIRSTRCILRRMTKVLTIRLDPDLLGKAEARAARMGLDRAKYVRALIVEDLANGGSATTRKFASEDLAGMYEGSGQAATNTTVRRRLQERAAASKP